jgi:hypothetical protein
LRGDLRIIRSGLSRTDRVVIAGTQRARPGAKVTPQPGRIVAGPAAGAGGAPSSEAPPASTALPAAGR